MNNRVSKLEEAFKTLREARLILLRKIRKQQLAVAEIQEHERMIEDQIRHAKLVEKSNES